MKSITNTFVLVAPDCPVSTARVPTLRGATPTIALIQYELLMAQPYTLILEDLIVATHVRRAGLSDAEANARPAEIRAVLFAKPHPCMQASPLPKTYGWGVHHDEAGRMALFGVESAEYHRFASGAIEGVELVSALRSKRVG